MNWLCWPRFDSPAIFAAILDSEQGGCWSIRPVGHYETSRAYVGDSNVLETQFFCSSGRATLTDLMPVSSQDFKRQNLVPDHELLRQLTCSDGEVEFTVDFYPRPEYGVGRAQIRDLGKLGLRLDFGRGAYWLRANVPLHLEGERAQARVALKHGDTLQFSLMYSEQSPAVLPALGERVRNAIARSIGWWSNWSGRASYHGPYRDAVMRSALVLKLLAYAPSGAIVAAPTTSLPERIGDNLNWDYRYCWLRDASLTTRALLGLGYMEEAESFLTWLLHATRLTQPRLRILYDVFGRFGARERNLAQLHGYRDSRPVRIGNGARHQLQLDVYGEVIDASAQYAQHAGRFDRATQRVLLGLGKYVAQNWDRPDEAIWEPRTGRRNNTHSRLLCWAALDRLLALDEKGLIEGVPRAMFSEERNKIRMQIEERAWNSEIESYCSELDGDSLDASLLRMSWYGFEQAECTRMKKTYRKICEELGTTDGLLFRYRREPPEGAFGICGFWGVEQLALATDTRQEAHSQFKRLLKYGNDLGLFAEETDPTTGDPLGNFPQAFTHVGLISAALTLEEQEQGTKHPAVHTGSDVRASGGAVA